MSSSNGTQQPPRIKTSPSLSRPSPHNSSSPGEWNNEYSVGTSHALRRAEHSGVIGRGFRGKRRGRGRGRGGRNQNWSSSEWSAGRGRGGRGYHHHQQQHHYNNNDNHGTADNGDYGEVHAPPPESSIGARSLPPLSVGGWETGAVDKDYTRRFSGRGGGSGGGGSFKRPAPPESAMSPEDRRPALRQRAPPADGQSSARDDREGSLGGPVDDYGEGGGRGGADSLGSRGHNPESNGPDQSAGGYDDGGVGRRGNNNNDNIGNNNSMSRERGGSNARATKREKRSRSRQMGGDGGPISDSGSPREDEGALIGNSVLQRREVKLKVCRALFCAACFGKAEML